MSEVTQILNAIDTGDPHAVAQLMSLVYDELRRLAAAQMAREKPGQTLNATALVHEAYLRLVASPTGERGEQPHFANRRHFFGAAAEAMRRILIDSARRKKSVKHGGGRHRIPLDEAQWISDDPDGLLALDDALTRFSAEEPAKAELVKLRFFAGLSTAEAAAALSISVATAERWWTFARTWLFTELGDGDDDKK